jgi:hypothetical protein
MVATGLPPVPVQLVTKLLPLLLNVVVAHAARIERTAQLLKTG